MSTEEDINEELRQIEREITKAKLKLEEAQKRHRSSGEKTDKRMIVEREKAVEDLENKRKNLMQRLVESKSIKRTTGRNIDLDHDEHLTERSSLRYGNVIDLDSIDLAEPSGGTADWLQIGLYILTFPIELLLRCLYILTTRGRQTIKENKGNRLRFKESSSVEEIGGVKTHRHLYISLPTAQSSMKSEEVTPGRFRTIACGLLAAETRLKRMISPVMGVIGFNYFVENWEEHIDKLLNEVSPHLPVQPGKPEEATNLHYFKLRQEELNKSKTKEIEELCEEAERYGFHLVKEISSVITPWLFAGSPDRCPPVVLYVAGIAELGAFFAILQDIRNTIMASKLVGTAEEKIKKKSSFYQSYLRRTQSMGVQLDQRIIRTFILNWGKMMVDHFHLGDDMDAELRRSCQALIDEKVKQISSQEPLKL
uniref:Nucleoprotein n=1 Tax=Loanvirus brunaense TaxID=3052281 RepID=A0AAU7PIY7_9VIRU